MEDAGDVGSFRSWQRAAKKDLVDSGFPAIHYGQLHTLYRLTSNNTASFVSEEMAARLKKAQKNDLLLATTSEDDADVGKPLAWGLGEEVAISGDMMLFRHCENVKYLTYFLTTVEFQEQKRKYISGAKVRRLSGVDLSKITVPIPCPNNPQKSLEIQGEIVRILDAFTDLTAELTAELTTELTNRRIQYKYYRDWLLKFEDDSREGARVEWRPLGKIGEFFRGKRFTKADLPTKGSVPSITAKSIRSMEPGPTVAVSKVRADLAGLVEVCRTKRCNLDRC